MRPEVYKSKILSIQLPNQLSTNRLIAYLRNKEK